jgi:hypothetical protein
LWPNDVWPYLAHVRRNEDESFVIHDLEAHLRSVGDLAVKFAAIFARSDLGHGIRKYFAAFQAYIAREK